MEKQSYIDSQVSILIKYLVEKFLVFKVYLKIHSCMLLILSFISIYQHFKINLWSFFPTGITLCGKSWETGKNL